jgi:hypothetical protein
VGVTALRAGALPGTELEQSGVDADGRKLVGGLPESCHAHAPYVVDVADASLTDPFFTSFIDAGLLLGRYGISSVVTLFAGQKRVAWPC